VQQEGFVDYITKDDAIKKLVEAIRRAAEG
jgi:DNA-binding NarL/FixJ family response regulator